MTIQPTSTDSFPISIHLLQDKIDKWLPLVDDAQLTTVQKELIYANLLADARGVTSIPVDAYATLGLQVMRETLRGKGLCLYMNQMLRGKASNSPFSTAQGESIHLAPCDIKKIVAKVKHEDAEPAFSFLYKVKKSLKLAFRRDRDSLPVSQKLPSWLTCKIDKHNNLLHLSGIPTLDDLEQDQVTLYFTITDKRDYIVKEFKLTVIPPAPSPNANSTFALAAPSANRTFTL